MENVWTKVVWSRKFRTLQNKEIKNLYRSPSIVRTVKSGWLQRAGHVVQTGKKETHTEFWLENF